MSEGVDRRDLPQIPKDKVESFIGFMEKKGIEVARGLAQTKDLKSTQHSYRRSKVEKLLQDEKALKMPLMVSKEGYILDGHHRWLAQRKAGNKMTPVVRFGCDIDSLIAMGHAFPASFRADEAKIPRPHLKSHSPENNEDDGILAPNNLDSFGANYGPNAYKEARDYKREYELYHGKPAQIKRRSKRNSSRREMVKSGRVKKGQDVHHKDNNPANMSSKNMVAMSKSKNRSMK